MSDNRDWQADMEMIEAYLEYRHLSNYPEQKLAGDPVANIIHYWLQQYAAEKERADNLESRHKSFLKVVQEATEHMTWRNEGNGTEIAIKLIYKWLEEHPAKEATE